MAELTSGNINVRVKTAIREVITEIDSITAIKPEQEFALVEFLGGKDVLAVLPTGFGKSLIHQLALLVRKKVFPGINPIFIVVWPLIELMNDQIKEAAKQESLLCGLVFTEIWTYNRDAASLYSAVQKIGC